MIKEMLEWMGFGDKSLVEEQKFSPVYARFSASIGRTQNRVAIKYDQFAREGYEINPVVRKSIDLKANNVADTKWKLFDLQGDEKIEITDSPLLDLLNRPNPAQTKEAFWQQALVFGEHGGSIFLHSVAPNDLQQPGDGGVVIRMANNPQPPKELYTYRPDFVDIVASRFGMIGKYIIRGSLSNSVGGQTSIIVDPLTGFGPMHHIKYANPLDGSPFGHGVAPVKSIAYVIDQYNEAVKWNTAALQHSIDPGGWWKHIGDEPLDPETFAEAKQQISEMMSGPQNAKRTLVVDQWEYTNFSSGIKDMDWSEMINSSSRNIAMGLGVPSQLLGIPGDNTYSNFEQANLAFWTQTMVPLINRITGELNMWLVPMFQTGNQRLILEPDYDEVAALAPIRAEKWATIASASFLTINEKRRALGFDDIENEEADVVFIPAGQLPLGFDAETMEDLKSAFILDGYSSKNAEQIAIKMSEYVKNIENKSEQAPDFAVDAKGHLMIMGPDGTYERI